MPPVRARLALLVLATGLACPGAASAAVTPLAPATAAASALAVAAPARGGATLVAVVGRQGNQDVLTLHDGATGESEELLRAPDLRRPVVAAGPGGAATVVVARTSTSAPFHGDLVVLRRPAGGAFGAPESVAGGDGFADVLGTDVAADGSVAVVGQVDRQGLLLQTGPADTATRVTGLGPVGTAGVALGDDGRLALATYADGTTEVRTRTAAPGRPLGPERVLTRLRTRPDLRMAIDDDGTATVTYARDLDRGIAVVAARARAGGAFGVPQVLDRGPNAQVAGLAAAGRSTAITYYDLTSPSQPVRVRLAVGPGRFGAVQTPATPTLRLGGYAGRTPSSVNAPSLAVDARGDVLLAWSYGPFGAVQAALHRAGTPGFGPRRVLSPLALGGAVVPALRADRTPLVAFIAAGGAQLATGLGGRAPALSPPGLTLTPITAAELRRDGTVTTRVRCSSDCLLAMRARLTAGTGASGQRISRQGRAPVVVRAGRAVTVRFTLPQEGRELLAATGRAQAKVIATAADASGATRSARVSFDVGRNG